MMSDAVTMTSEENAAWFWARSWRRAASTVEHFARIGTPAARKASRVRRHMEAAFTRNAGHRVHHCGRAYQPSNATYCWFCHCG